MPIEQMNISLSPQMARFIRGKVKKGQYTNVSEVVRDAVRHLQVAEERQAEAKRGVERGIRDLETGAFQDFDEAGLKDYFASVNERGKKRLAAETKQPS